MSQEIQTTTQRPAPILHPRLPLEWADNPPVSGMTIIGLIFAAMAAVFFLAALILS